MTKRRGLGRGLGSLIPGSDTTDTADGTLPSVPIDSISPNPHQPRSHMDEGELAELAASIRGHGLIQPLIVNRVDENNYTLIAGERRWRAAKIAGLGQVPVVVKDATPQDMLELALIENIQRADLNALEEATAYQHLIVDFGLTQEEVARRVGKSRPTVANLVRLLKLPDNIQAAILDGRISGAHARALLPLPTPRAQTAVMNSIIKLGWNVRQVEATVEKRLNAEKPKPKSSKLRPAEVIALESQFRQSLGAEVKIDKRSEGGKVIIYFYSDEELQSIYEAITGDRE